MNHGISSAHKSASDASAPKECFAITSTVTRNTLAIQRTQAIGFKSESPTGNSSGSCAELSALRVRR